MVSVLSAAARAATENYNRYEAVLLHRKLALLRSNFIIEQRGKTGSDEEMQVVLDKLKEDGSYSITNKGGRL